MGIPDGIRKSCGLSNSSKDSINKDLVNDVQHSQHQKHMRDNYMVIEILNDVILQGLPMTSVTSEHSLQTDQGHNVEKLFISISYQSIRFQTISCF